MKNLNPNYLLKNCYLQSKQFMKKNTELISFKHFYRVWTLMKMPSSMMISLNLTVGEQLRRDLVLEWDLDMKYREASLW
jgi:hypothetical protein